MLRLVQLVATVLIATPQAVLGERKFMAPKQDASGGMDDASGARTASGGMDASGAMAREASIPPEAVPFVAEAVPFCDGGDSSSIKPVFHLCRFRRSAFLSGAGVSVFDLSKFAGVRVIDLTLF